MLFHRPTTSTIPYFLLDFIATLQKSILEPFHQLSRDLSGQMKNKKCSKSALRNRYGNLPGYGAHNKVLCLSQAPALGFL